MSGRYDDILRRERPQIPGHPAMPRAARAAQFAPFAALTGYGAVVAEVNRQTEPRADLAEDAQAALQETLRRLPRARAPAPAATYFVPDARKSGGAYVTAVGALRRIDEAAGLVLEGGARIPLDDLSDLALQSGTASRRPPQAAAERGRLCHGRGRAAPHRRSGRALVLEGGRASPGRPLRPALL